MNIKGILAILVAVVLVLGGLVLLSRNKVILSPTTQIGVSTPTSSPTVQPIDKEGLKATIKQLLIAKHGKDAGQLNISVTKTEGNYASGGASAQSGGGMWFAAKVNGVWKLVWDGNGTISCADLAPYPDLPTSMISSCIDPKTNEPVSR